MNGFVAVHCGEYYLQQFTLIVIKQYSIFENISAGAGYHSDTLKKKYKKLCYVACRKATETLTAGGTAMDAIENAIIGK